MYDATGSRGIITLDMIVYSEVLVSNLGLVIIYSE